MLHKEDFSRRMINESEDALFFLNWFISQTKKTLDTSTAWETLSKRWDEKFLTEVITEYCIAGSVVADYFFPGPKKIYYPEELFFKLSNKGDHQEIYLEGESTGDTLKVTNRVIHIRRPHDKPLIQAYSCHVDVDSFSTNEFEFALTNALSLRDSKTGKHL